MEVRMSASARDVKNYDTNRLREEFLIDDLFKGSISGSDVNIMFEIINFRYLNSLPVIASCEMGIDEIMKIDEAIGSRIYEMCEFFVSVSGKRLNYRMYKKS